MRPGRRNAVLCIMIPAVAALLAIGCSSSFTSGLPDHVRTVEVQLFQNKTMYYSTEAWITRSIIDRINADPRIQVVSRNGDGLITGEILSVQRSTLRETTTNEPGTVQITITAEFSFYDNVRRRYLIEDMTVTSSGTGRSPGIYEPTLGGSSEEGERGAAAQLAAEIVRRTVGMW